MASNILNISESPKFYESITKKVYHTYSPFIESYNVNDTIRICIQNQDLVLVPSESFLYTEGTVKAKTGTTKVPLNNNCVAFMFDEIRYELNGVEIDQSRNLGITTSMKNYVSLTPSESNALINAGWNLTDNNGRIKLGDDGRFNFCVPLKMLLGFAEDYTKIIPNAKHELILTRAKSNNSAVNVDPTTTDLEYDFTISKISWRVPHIVLSDAERLKMYKTIQSSQPLKVCFRSWNLHEYPNIPKSTNNIWRVKTANQLEKPRYILFGLQRNKLNNKNENSSKFDHSTLTNLKVHLNSETYPYDNLNVMFNEDRYALLYYMYSKFQESYYGNKPSPLLNPTQFKNLAPIAVIDCSYQNEVLKSGPVDVKIEFEVAAGGIEDNTSAFCLLLHDRIIEYVPLSGDVKKII